MRFVAESDIAQNVRRRRLESAKHDQLSVGALSIRRHAIVVLCSIVPLQRAAVDEILHYDAHLQVEAASIVDIERGGGKVVCCSVERETAHALVA